MTFGVLNRDKNYFSVAEPLLPVESSAQLTQEAAVTTVTFFSGASTEAVADVARERLRLVLKSNPWIAGKVVKDAKKYGKRCQLVFDPLDDVPDDVIDAIFQVNPPELTDKIRPTMKYGELCKVVSSSSAIVPRLGPGYLYKSTIDVGRLLTRMTVVSSGSGEDCAVIFSMSHTIADGHTYYHILNMLSITSDPLKSPMQVKRVQEAAPKMIEAQGKADYDFTTSIGHIGAAAMGAMFGKKARLYTYYVDETKIATKKAICKEVASKEGKETVIVSHNDIITSAFGNCVDGRLINMAVNWRGRVEGIMDPFYAGNYEYVLWLDKQQYQSPLGVRECLQSGPPYFKSHGDRPLPGMWEALTKCKFGNIVNWAGFIGELVFVEGCEQKLHVPIVPMNLIPYETCLIFRPVANRLAVMYFSKRFGRDEILEKMPLGEPVSRDMFG